MATTTILNDPANEVVDAVIESLETQFTKVKKGELVSSHLIKSLWSQVPPSKQAKIVKKYPEIKSIVASL